MTLARPVFREGGQVLVGEGTELSAGLLERLQAMAVESITVQGRPVQMEGLGEGTDYATRLERLEHLFRHHQGNAFMGSMKTQLARFFQHMAAAEAAGEAGQTSVDPTSGAALPADSRASSGTLSTPSPPASTSAARADGFWARLLRRLRHGR
ncbi:hypothetical protein [Megalodesulfovibrio paquesii]